MTEPLILSLFSFDSLFFSFSIAVARASKTLLNESDESGHPCLVPDLRGNIFSFSSLSMMLAVGLSYMAFIMLKYVLYVHFQKRFFLNHKWY